MISLAPFFFSLAVFPNLHGQTGLKIAYIRASCKRVCKRLNVTLISTGSPTGNYGITNIFSSSPILNNVTIYAAGRISQGISNGFNSNPVLNNVNISAYSDPRFAQNDVAEGIANSGSSPKLNNVTIKAYGGNIDNIGIINVSDYTGDSFPIIVNSNISATVGIYSGGSSIFNSIIDGTISGGTKCVNVIDSSFNQINCQP